MTYNEKLEELIMTIAETLYDDTLSPEEQAWIQGQKDGIRRAIMVLDGHLQLEPIITSSHVYTTVIKPQLKKEQVDNITPLGRENTCKFCGGYFCYETCPKQRLRQGEDVDMVYADFIKTEQGKHWLAENK